MLVCTHLIGFDTGDFTLDEAIADFERGTGGNVAVIRTRQTSPGGLPLVRLVGEPKHLHSVLQDGWDVTFDEAFALIEQ